jgi:anti-sigma regulatory factor (Ser/Thr protein kinase)
MSGGLQVVAARDSLRPLCAYVVQAAQAANLNDKDVYQCELAVEEACVNIIHYGCAASPDPAHCHIEISTALEGDYFIIWIRDNSPAFNPILQPNVDMADESNKLEPGGWGIHFFKKLMHDISYSYQDGQNVLTLRKKLA